MIESSFDELFNNLINIVIESSFDELFNELLNSYGSLYFEILFMKSVFTASVTFGTTYATLIEPIFRAF